MEHSAVQMMDIDRLTCQNVREHFGEEGLVALAQTITESGVLQPLLVRREGDLFIVLDGERRLRAAKRVGLRTVPVIIEERALAPFEVVRRQLVLDCQKVHLSAIERARAIDRLMREGTMPAAQVAVTLGMSPAQVSKYLTLLVAPPEIQERVSKGELAASTAYHITRVRDTAERDKLAEEAARGDLTRDDAAAKTKAAGRRVRPRQPRPHRERVVFPLAAGSSVAVSAPELNVGLLVNWIGDLFATLTRAHAEGLALPEVVKSLSAR
jgi:ParB family chromosome partitioning protein